jgi:hypothetical protein
MTRLRLVSGLLLAFVFFANPLLSQASYNAKYAAVFVRGDLSFDKLAGYDRVRLKGGDWLSDIAKPMLPAKELRIALPAGLKVTSVYATDARTQAISGEYNIYPAQPPKKTDLSDDDVKFIEPDKAIYASAQEYPSKLVELIRQTDLAGQAIAVVRVYPLQYVPAEKKLILYTSFNLTLEGTAGYECGDYLSPNISEKDRETYEQMLKDMVVNPEDVHLNAAMTLNTPSLLPPGSFGHVIITSTSFVSAFQPLVNWHTKKGVKDTVVTIDAIYTAYSGATNQEKVRNFVIDAHTTWGTTYFLIGGENETVPFEYRTYYNQENTPSDQYYSDYDDDWTNEVFVGRIPAGNSSGVTNFVNKVLKYETDPPRTSYPLNILLIGMDLDASTPSQDTKEAVYAYLPSRFNVTKVYDSDAGSHKTATINALNAGQNLVNHSDHSNYNVMGTGYFHHNLLLSQTDVNALTNDNKMSIIVSTGCLPNKMDASDCIAETFVESNPNQAGVAFTGNTRDGWYDQGDPSTLTAALDIQWWAALFNRNKYNLGQTLADGKHNFSTPSNIQKHCEWEFNLLGEPEMPIWTDEPDSFAITFPSAIPVGSSSFTVNVEDSTTHSPVYQACVCLWKGSEVYLKGYTNSSGNITFDLSPSTQGIMYVTVTKHNYLPYQDSASVASPVVRTDPATEVEETTATIRGYLDNDGGFEATCWLMWDTDSGEPYANSESLGVFPDSSEFTKQLAGLSEGTVYYFKAKGDNLAGWGSGEELAFLTKPQATTGLTAQGISWDKTGLSWTKPLSSDRTVIERDTLTAWTRGEGIRVYDDTGTAYQDSGLAPLTHYYYQTWSYSSEGELFQYSDEFDTADATTLFRYGDTNADRQISVSDVIYLINYLFKGGSAPVPVLEAGDANCDGKVLVSDVIYLINYLFKSGPAPGC